MVKEWYNVPQQRSSSPFSVPLGCAWNLPPAVLRPALDEGRQGWRLVDKVVQSTWWLTLLFILSGVWRKVLRNMTEMMLVASIRKTSGYPLKAKDSTGLCPHFYGELPEDLHSTVLVEKLEHSSDSYSLLENRRSYCRKSGGRVYSSFCIAKS